MVRSLFLALLVLTGQAISTDAQAMQLKIATVAPEGQYLKEMRAAGDAINLALSFTPQGRGLRPWSPVRIKGVWQGSGDITLSWLRRTRSLAGDSWNSPEVPLGEASESYDVEILNSVGSVTRTVNGVGLAAWTYTAAMQTADFGALVTSLRLRIFQNGQLGRGAPAEAILTP